MTEQAYDEKNINDYDTYTKLLEDALSSIEKDHNLPATQEQLVLMTGIHRNTIRERAFPKKRLTKIKEKRKIKAKEEKQKKKDELDELKDKLEKVSKEVVHWFSEYRITKRDKDDFNKQNKILEESRAFYEKEVKKEREKTANLSKENELLKELLRDIKK
jgi:hypothetical protein